MDKLSMLASFVEETTQIVHEDDQAVVELMGIGRFMFRHAMEYGGQRVIDLGIMEQNAVGFAAGLSSEGMIPFLYTWAPFLIERAFDQIRLFGSQGSSGNFIGAGGSYELADFGDSHYCPECIPILKQIKDMEIIVPGTGDEFRRLLRQTYADSKPTYYSLSSFENTNSYDVDFDRANLIRSGSKGVVIVVGPMLHFIEEYLPQMDANVLYYTTVEPFDYDALSSNITGERILICEPYQSGAILGDVVKAVGGKMEIDMLGFEKNAVCRLGTFAENLEGFGLDADHLRAKLEPFM